MANVLLPLLGSIGGAFVTYKTTATVAAGAQAALNAVMNANPIGIVVTLLGALAGAFGTAYASSETFRTGVNSAFTAVANTAQNALSTVIGWLDRLSFKLNKALNKDGYSTFDTYEGWKASQSKSTVTDDDRQRRQQLHDSRVQQAQTEKELADLTGGGVIVSDTRPPPAVPAPNPPRRKPPRPSCAPPPTTTPPIPRTPWGRWRPRWNRSTSTSGTAPARSLTA